MIRKKASRQKTKRGIKKTANYILKDKGCCLYEVSFIHNPKTIKGDLVERLSKEIDDDVNYHNNNRKIGSAQQVRTYHDIVSFHTNDDMNPQKALQIAKELYEKTHNLSNRKYLMAVHNDTDEMHVHIIWSVRDNNGKTYKQKDDYRIIEIECDKLEDKYTLIKPQNRKATSTKKNDLERLPSTNERMLDVRGITSNKKQLKDALKPFLDNAKSPSDFINQISQNGFNIIHNGKSAFSIQHDDQTFKASELNLSYKTLKAKLGEDLEFEKTLALRHGKKEHEQCGISSNDDKPEFMKRIHPQSTLAKHFTCTPFNDKIEYFYNSAKDKKAFEYHKDPAKVLFNDISRKSAKAGLQRLVADTEAPSTLTVFGAKEFRRNAWIEAQLMGLEAKGFKLEGYTPTPADLELVKKTQEQYASMNKKPEPKPEAPTVAVEPPKPVEPIIVPPVMPTPAQTAPETPQEPIKQVEQESNFDSLFDELEDEFSDKSSPADSFKEILSKVTTDMLCITHGSITCRICFGSNMENARTSEQDEFANINIEIATAYANAGRAWKEEFNQLLSDRVDELQSTPEHQEKVEAAHIADVETDFHSFIESLIDKHTDYKRIEILRHVQDVLEDNENIIPDAALYDDITEKVNQLDNHEREICSAYVKKLIDDGGSGAPIDGELKNADVKSKRKIRYNPY